MNMVFFKESVGACVCAKLPIYIDRAVNQLFEKTCNNAKNHFCEVEVYAYNLCGKRHCCMYAVCPFI